VDCPSHTKNHFFFSDEIFFATFLANGDQYYNFFGGDITVNAVNAFIVSQTTNVVAYGGDITFNFDNQAFFTASTMDIFGYLSIPMTHEQIITGAPCFPPTNTNVQRILLARDPPYDVYYWQAPAPEQYSFFLEDIYQGLGLRLCTCGNPFYEGYTYSCMSLSQFAKQF